LYILVAFFARQVSHILSKRAVSPETGQEPRSLSKIAPQSRICVKSWTVLLSGAVLNWLVEPTAGQDMCRQRGQIDWQITTCMVCSVPLMPASAENISQQSISASVEEGKQGGTFIASYQFAPEMEWSPLSC
jgi:hypothetical protein